MHNDPIFTDHLGRPIRRALRSKCRPKRNLTRWQKFILIFLAFMSCPLLVKDVGALTQFDLVTQVRGLLSPAHGGTGLATLTAHNVMLGEGTSNVGFVSCGAGT